MSESEVYHSPFYEERKVMKLPPSAKFIMYLLKLKGPMNRKRIIRETLMPDRTVGFALKLLLEEGFIKKEDPAITRKRTSEGKRRRKKIDHRITNYALTLPMFPYELAEV
jgi:predicted transcriptional regulator